MRRATSALVLASLGLAPAAAPAAPAHAPPKPVFAGQSGVSGGSMIRPGAHGAVGGPSRRVFGLDGGAVHRPRK